jgi:hypothetical protein
MATFIVNAAQRSDVRHSVLHAGTCRAASSHSTVTSSAWLTL